MSGGVILLTPSERGRKGGQRTLEEYGTQHMRIIGRAGYEAVLERHYSGDASEMHAHLLRLRHAPKTWCERSQCWKREQPVLCILASQKKAA
jgi:hypothetical protein